MPLFALSAAAFLAARCILHIGPRKTGAASLQRALVQFSQELQPGGFWLPPALPDPQRGAKNVANIGKQLKHNSTGGAWPASKGWLKTNPTNVIAGSETFDALTPAQTKPLAAVLAPYEVAAVLGYRPFYDFPP